MAGAAQNDTVKPISITQPCVVSFSGIDGSGKTTQIDAVLAWLHDAGLRVRVLRFWDDISVLGSLRETMSHTLFKSEQGVGSPEKPVQRRDKNVRAWYMTAARLFLYFLDAARLAFVVATTSSKNADVLVFDRYLYDELANLDLGNPIVRGYVRLLLRLVPRPDVALLLDADPVEARARKPEYPLDFIHLNRASYLAIATLAGGVTVIPPLRTQDVTRVVLAELATTLSRVPSAAATARVSPDLTSRSHQ
jgi:thymidylate kinase